MTVDIKSLPLPALTEFFLEMNEPTFRAGQVFRWLHKQQIIDFERMSNLSAALLGKLREKSYINSLKIKKKLVSEIDNTVKYLYELRDGNCVETVLMQYRHGNSLCISTQVGCRMGCKFCASTLSGLARNLTASEMLDQIYATSTDTGIKIDSIVLMGIGEPLDNLENVLDFFKILSHPDGLGLSLRHVSLSTCGLVDQMALLAKEKLPLTLSVSLHAPNDLLRSKTMPINNHWPISVLIDACKSYFAATGRRISFEYALIHGLNDKQSHAVELAALLKGMNCHVNLIPVNTVAETNFQRSSRQSVTAFLAVLEKYKITATVRRELGTDISAACGQLRRAAL